MRKLLLIDNYDSFTFNLSQAFQRLGSTVHVYPNDAIDLQDAMNLAPTHLVISPGPGKPSESGVSVALVKGFAAYIPILGVCLGHQAIATAFGGQVARARSLMHGKDSSIYHDGQGLYAGLSNPFHAGRYHSLAIVQEALPEGFTAVAHTDDGEVMGIRHRQQKIRGVQFHPESILTPEGDQLLQNFLDLDRNNVTGRYSPPSSPPADANLR
jgi:anthranilate synthase/aminodeoxychorismate synthase-like glutamine amidotransferase